MRETKARADEAEAKAAVTHRELTVPLREMRADDHNLRAELQRDVSAWMRRHQNGPA